MTSANQTMHQNETNRFLKYERDDLSSDSLLSPNNTFSKVVRLQNMQATSPSMLQSQTTHHHYNQHPHHSVIQSNFSRVFEPSCPPAHQQTTSTTTDPLLPSPVSNTRFVETTLHRPASNEPAPKNPTKTLFVGNLAVEVSEGMLMDLFSRYGNVTECCKRWYHYAFIQYSTEEQAHDALIALDGHRISGRAMRVEFQRKKIRAIERMNDDVGLCLTGHHLLENKSPTNSISGYSFQHHHHCSGSHGGNCSHVNSGIPSPLDGRQRKTPDPPRSIYISMEDTDSYFSKPGEQVAICTDFKLYELFPRNACYENDILDSYYGNRTSKKMTSVDFNFLHAATLRKVVVQNVPASVSMSIGNKI